MNAITVDFKHNISKSYLLIFVLLYLNGEYAKIPLVKKYFH